MDVYRFQVSQERGAVVPRGVGRTGGDVVAKQCRDRDGRHAVKLQAFGQRAKVMLNALKRFGVKPNQIHLVDSQRYVTDAHQ